MENKIIGEYINILPQKDISKLPKAWVLTKVGEICSCEKNKGQEGAIPYLEIGNINILTKKYFPGRKPAVRSAFLSRKGDILISRVRPTRGAVIITLEEELHVSSALTVLRPLLGIPSKFLHYFLAWNQTFFKFLGENSTGTMYPTVKEDFILEYTIPLPPLSEQHRIVAKIEELFTKLDVGVELLKKIKKQLRLYRQKVLKHAFEGKLTEEWREKHKYEVEPVLVLLERKREERRDEESEEKKQKRKELPPVNVSHLPELPKKWLWTRVGEVSEMIQYGTSEKAKDNPPGIPVLRMGNIQDGKLDFENLKYLSKTWSQLDKFILKDGDVLFNRTNSAELVGKTAVYKNYHPSALFASYLIRIKINKSIYLPELLSFFINSFYGRKYIISIVSQQAGQANVNGTKLSLMPIPLPPLLEQQKLVEEIEQRFSTVDELERVADQSLKQAKKLRQSILKRAFEGKLIPQDPNDEPASILLEKIKREKVRIEEEKKVKKLTRRRK